MSTRPPALGEGWTICSLDDVHWGANGGAGLLLRYRPTEGDPRYLLVLRSRSVDEPATWGIPGGAIRDGESPEAAACREMMEETGRLPAYSVVAEEVQDCGGGWRFHLFPPMCTRWSMPTPCARPTPLGGSPERR